MRIFEMESEDLRRIDQFLYRAKNHSISAGDYSDSNPKGAALQIQMAIQALSEAIRLIATKRA